VSDEAARQGIVFENGGKGTLVTLRYFGPGTNPQAPSVGSYRNH